MHAGNCGPDAHSPYSNKKRGKYELQCTSNAYSLQQTARQPKCARVSTVQHAGNFGTTATAQLEAHAHQQSRTRMLPLHLMAHLLDKTRMSQSSALCRGYCCAGRCEGAAQPRGRCAGPAVEVSALCALSPSCKSAMHPATTLRLLLLLLLLLPPF